jgi:hypothetical protein
MARNREMQNISIDQKDGRAVRMHFNSRRTVVKSKSLMDNKYSSYVDAWQSLGPNRSLHCSPSYAEVEGSQRQSPSCKVGYRQTPDTGGQLPSQLEIMSPTPLLGCISEDFTNRNYVCFLQESALQMPR